MRPDHSAPPQIPCPEGEGSPAADDASGPPVPAVIVDDRHLARTPAVAALQDRGVVEILHVAEIASLDDVRRDRAALLVYPNPLDSLAASLRRGCAPEEAIASLRARGRQALALARAAGPALAILDHRALVELSQPFLSWVRRHVFLGPHDPYDPGAGTRERHDPLYHLLAAGMLQTDEETSAVFEELEARAGSGSQSSLRPSARDVMAALSQCRAMTGEREVPIHDAELLGEIATLQERLDGGPMTNEGVPPGEITHLREVGTLLREYENALVREAERVEEAFLRLSATQEERAREAAERAMRVEDEAFLLREITDLQHRYAALACEYENAARKLAAATVDAEGRTSRNRRGFVLLKGLDPRRLGGVVARIVPRIRAPSR